MCEARRAFLCSVLGPVPVLGVSVAGDACSRSAGVRRAGFAGGFEAPRTGGGGVGRRCCGGEIEGFAEA